MGEGLFGVALDQAFNESGLSDTRRAYNGNDNGGRFFWKSVDLRYVEPFLFDVARSHCLLCQTAWIGDGEGLGVPLSFFWRLFLFRGPMRPIGLCVHCAKARHDLHHQLLLSRRFFLDAAGGARKMQPQADSKMRNMPRSVS
jgi:hypothetical protein